MTVYQEKDMITNTTISLTSWIIATVLKTSQAFEKDLKDLPAGPWHMVVEIGKDS